MAFGIISYEIMVIVVALWRTIRQPRAIVMIAAFVLSGCTAGSTGVTGLIQCADSSDCPTSWLCVDTICAQACIKDADCPQGDQVCDNGVCIDRPGANCTEDSECVSPIQCRVAPDARCIGGECVYAPGQVGVVCDDDDFCTENDACDAGGDCVGVPKVCNSPPPAECVNSNRVFRSYPADGTCNPLDGTCGYTPIDTDCNECAANCLAACGGILCNDFRGGCQSNGLCVPDTPPRCSYDSTANGTPCTMTSGATAFCVAGSCADCLSVADCVDPPPGIDDNCLSISCVSLACQYDLLDSTTPCTLGSCSNGVAEPPRECGTDRDCVALGSVSCNGYPCNVAGDACATSCVLDSDCMPQFFCSATNTCVGRFADGLPCSIGATCLSGTCNNGFCCSSPSGDCCGSTSDCPASYGSAPVCAIMQGAVDCQGTRVDSECVGSVCASLTVDDDSACDATVKLSCTSNFASIDCTGVDPQTPPVCLATCVPGAGDCALGYFCDGGSGACVLFAGIGDPCNSPSECGSGLKCENNICCPLAASTCCAGDAQCSATGTPCRSSWCVETCTDYTTNDCADPATTYCINDRCVAKRGDGLSCVSAAECVSGFCADGVCCESACDNTCLACHGFLTTGNTADSGSCLPIDEGRQDLAPTPLCTSAGDGCPVGSCACKNGACLHDLGQICATDTDCVSDICECADTSCLVRACAPVRCGVCDFFTGGGCSGALGTSGPADDPEDCTDGAVGRSCYNGTCLLDEGAPCLGDGDCGSGNCECADDTCSTQMCAAVSCSQCMFTQSGAVCNGQVIGTCSDGDPCTLSDTCNAGVCEAGIPRDCSDGDVCTDDYCNTGIGNCEHSDNTALCDDNDPCTTFDSCDQGLCVGAQQPDCDDQDICTTDTCDSTTPAGEDPCRHTRSCSCVSAAECDDGNVCTDDDCVGNPASCINVFNSAPCVDADLCTVNDVCFSGICATGQPKNCDDSNVCTDDSCNPATGGCDNIANSAPCEDGDLCTENDVCFASSCVPGSQMDCDDSNICTDDSCAGGSCIYAANTRACDDGNLCSIPDTCVASSCVPGPMNTCDDSYDCTTDTCDPATGACSNTPRSGSCDDLDLCTDTDTCSGSTCVGTPIVCNLTCFDGTCNPVSGGCDFTPNDTLTCDLGVQCVTYACSGGTCEGTTCSSLANRCMTTQCDASTGFACNQIAAADGLTCNFGTPDYYCNGLGQCCLLDCSKGCVYINCFSL